MEGLHLLKDGHHLKDGSGVVKKYREKIDALQKEVDILEKTEVPPKPVADVAVVTNVILSDTPVTVTDGLERRRQKLVPAAMLPNTVVLNDDFVRGNLCPVILQCGMEGNELHSMELGPGVHEFVRFNRDNVGFLNTDPRYAFSEQAPHHVSTRVENIFGVYTGAHTVTLWAEEVQDKVGLQVRGRWEGDWDVHFRPGARPKRTKKSLPPMTWWEWTTNSEGVFSNEVSPWGEKRSRLIKMYVDRPNAASELDGFSGWTS